jgi:Ca2+-binding RTX toxin-like protein
MDTFDLACAVLSSAAYQAGFDPKNRISPLSDAVRLPGTLGYKSIGGSSGFEASAYEYQGKIVVSYAGTNTDQGGDMVANLGLGFGISHLQLLQAADFYQSIKNDPAYAGREIVFTGHSLGGGLAAAMGVFFDKHAVTFDPAPFRLAVTQSNARDIAAYVRSVHPSWAVDSNLQTYTTVEGIVGLSVPATSAALVAAFPLLGPQIATLPYPITIRGEGNIRAYSVSGEFLTNGYQGLARSDLNALRIQAGGQPENININPAGAVLEPFDLHSMNLLIVAAKEPRLEALFHQNPRLTEALFDKGLYAHKPSDNETDFLARLVQQEFGGAASVSGAGVLAKFADDLIKLMTSTVYGMTGQSAIAKALTVAAMEYYYYLKDLASISSLFAASGSGVDFKYSDIGSESVKSRSLLVTAIRGYLGRIETRALGMATDITEFGSQGTGYLMAQDAWHIQAGSAGLNWTGTGNDADAVIGGPGVDIIDAGAGNDILIGGPGRDFLTGGSGDDRLLGGLDVDTYVFAAQSGKDIVSDLDGQGLILVDGASLTGGKPAGEPNVWASKGGAGDVVNYSVYDDRASSTGKKLVVTRAGDKANSITVTDFNFVAATTGEGYLGIKLDTTKRLVFGAAGEGAISNGSPYKDDPDFVSATTAVDASVAERGAQQFRIYLNQGAKAGDQMIVSVNQGNAALLKLTTGADTLDLAQPVTLTLGEGQTDIVFSVEDSEFIDADQTFGLQAKWVSTPGASGGSADTASSNTVTLTVKDSGETVATYRGDQRGVTGAGGLYDWPNTSWAADGTLTGGVAEAGFSDVIKGTAVADKISGLGGDDALDGGAGNDVIDGGDGNDIIAGGAGSDIITGGLGNDLIYSAGSLNAPQRVRADGWTATYANSFGSLGTDDAGDVVDAGGGNDEVRGSYGDDHISGGAGDDALLAMAGDDVLEGGDGADELIGDAPEALLAGDRHGNDFLDGGAGDDSLFGGGKDDALFGGAGNDELNGDGVESELSGQFHGDDYLDGEDGNDRLFGGGGDDTLYGGSGDDILDGDARTTDLATRFDGDDYLDGEEGDDKMYGQGGADTLYGGAGNDKMWGDASEDIGDANYVAAQYQGDDYLDGEEGDDYIEGNGGADTIYGGTGADTLWGDGTAKRVAGDSQGADYIDGEEGNDIILGGGGADTLLGGEGDDNIRGDASGQMPSDPAYLAGQFHGDDSLDGGDGNDQMWGDGGNDILIGGAGNDILSGDDTAEFLPLQFHGNDYLDGGEGDDVLLGGGGDDILIGGAGSDYLDGGEGNDTYEVTLGDTVHDSGGTNTIRLDGGAPMTVAVQGEDLVLVFGAGGAPQSGAPAMRVMANTVTTGPNSLVIENAFQGGGFTLNESTLDADFFSGYDVTLTTTADHQHLSGWGGNDTLTAEHVDATLDGGAGNDVLTGSWGNDLLIGGSGSNTLWGGAGDDILISSGQSDVLDGAEGNDTYRIAAAAGEVTIAVGMAQDAGQDTVVLAGSSAGTTLTASIIDADAVITSTRHVTAADGTVTQQAGTTIRLANFFDATRATPIADSVATISFEDGSSVSLAQLLTSTTMGGATDDNLKGSTFVDHIDGGAGNDQIHAGAGNDTLIGGPGNDSLYGDSGKDVLEGGDGNDVLRGGDGSDILRGGAGDDTYVFGAELAPEVAGDREEAQQIDVIEDSQGNNIILLGNGVNLEGVAFRKVSDSLSTLFFNGQRIEIHGPTTGFTVQANGVTRTLDSFVPHIDAVVVDAGLTEAQRTFLEDWETKASAAISDAVLDGRFAKYTDGSSSLRKRVESNAAQVSDIALPVDATIETEYYGVTGFADAAGNPVTSPGPSPLRGSLAANVVWGDYTRTLPATKTAEALQKIFKDQGKKIDVYEVAPTAIYLGPDQLPPGYQHGQVISWTWEGYDRSLVDVYGHYTATSFVTHKDAHAANVLLGDGSTTLTVGAGVVHAGGGNDTVMDLANRDSNANADIVSAIQAGVTASFLDGGDGDDLVVGSQLNDVIYGGRGHDLLNGGTGSDRYLVLDYGQSSGDEDVIMDTDVTSTGYEPPFVFYTGLDVDTVEFGPGIALADLYFLREANPNNPDGPGLLVAVRDGRRLVSIGLADPNDHAGAGVEFLQFQDGRILTLGDALSMAHEAVPLTAGSAAEVRTPEDGLFLYTVAGIFGGGSGKLTYSATLADGSALPDWLRFDAATLSLVGTLVNEPVATYAVKVSVIDQAGATASADLSIAIDSVNDAPVPAALMTDQTAFQDQAFVLQLGDELFADADVGDTLSWRLQLSDGRPLPAWLSFDALTRTLSGTPTNADSGVLNLQIVVTDGANTSGSQLFHLNVTETDGIDITGTAGSDNLIGSAGDDHIDGLGRADVMDGGDGDDVYVVDNTRDLVIETWNHGYDRIESQVSFTLPGDVEAITLKGTRNLAATGNLLDNELIGNSGSNLLDGRGGSDKMSGGAGNDVYEVDSEGDEVVERAGEGTDTVRTMVNYTLSSNVERLTLRLPGLVGTGNELANLMIAGGAGSTLYGLGGNDTLRGGLGGDNLFGGDGNDRLEGGDGRDHMEGGTGNDVYLVNDGLNEVVESAGEGTDTVQAFVSFTLTANVENLTLSGIRNLEGTGNELANTIVGNASDNRLIGLGGNDRLRGGAGDDALFGGDGNDRLDGGAGADYLAGGTGNDTYILDDAGDTVDEFADEGTDTVQTSLSFVLGANVENLTLTGAGLLSGVGNELNNVLTANAAGSVLYGLAGNDTLKGGAARDVLYGGDGNDRLDGGAFGDTLVGGIGNDVYVVDSVADEVIELADEGTDTVQTALTYTLGANLENLTLTGVASLHGNGNELANVITANGAGSQLAGLAGNDTLRGGAAADLLIGGAGNDRLEGGLGGDTYDFGRGDGQDTIVENDATPGVVDTLHFEAGIGADQLWWRKAGNNLEVSVIGSTDKVTLANWYLGDARHVEVFELANGKHMLDTQVQALVQAMASFAPPAAGQTSLPSNYQISLEPVIAANWQ